MKLLEMMFSAKTYGRNNAADVVIGFEFVAGGSLAISLDDLRLVYDAGHVCGVAFEDTVPGHNITQYDWILAEHVDDLSGFVVDDDQITGSAYRTPEQGVNEYPRGWRAIWKENPEVYVDCSRYEHALDNKLEAKKSLRVEIIDHLRLLRGSDDEE